MVDSVLPPIIIGGCHRSGTTLLRRLINAHPRIYCPPEIKFHKDLLGQFPNDPLRHGRLGASMRAMELPTEIWLDEFGAALVRCFERATRIQGKKRWADKNPENALNVPHWDRLLKGRLFFIMVIRHPFDIVSSMAETPMPLVIPSATADRARHVAHYITGGMEFAQRHPERSWVIKYEDLVREPARILSELLAKLNEDFHETMLTDSFSQGQGQGLGDPKARKWSGVADTNVERWRRDLSSADCEILCNELGHLTAQLGYRCR